MHYLPYAVIANHRLRNFPGILPPKLFPGVWKKKRDKTQKTSAAAQSNVIIETIM